MCGIAGILDFKGKKLNKSLMGLITNKMTHRGPDGFGVFQNKESNLILGHRRLSIIDLTKNASQPMTLLDRYTITFNGEIYNYLELKSKLKKIGWKFNSDSDTEVLLKCYIEFGSDCLKLLDGMFAFAIWDDKKKHLFCARDRFGEKPFYYSFTNSQFIFASEIKALFVAGIDRKINNEKLYNYLIFNTTNSVSNKDKTFYENVNELSPANFIVINKNGEIIENSKYWKINLDSKLNISIDDAIDIFNEKFKISVERRLRSDVPVGSSLSGGLDSSAIVYTIDQLKTQNLKQKTFSARFKNFERDEGVYMNSVINQMSSVQPHFLWTNESLIEKKLDYMFSVQEGPFISPGIIVQHEIMKLAKENNVTVLLDGQGADEIAAGYHGFFKFYMIEKIRQNVFNYRNYKTLIKKNSDLGVNNLNLNLILEAFFPKLVNYFRNLNLHNKNKSSINPEFFGNINRANHPYSLRKNLNESLLLSTTQVGLRDLLRYADKNSMANSLEVRLPFLSHELVEFIFKLPSEFKIFEGWTKFIIRKSFEKKLPNQIIWRKDKVGYMPPIRRWLNSKNVKEMIISSQKNLIKEKIISKPLMGQEWTYLMADRLIRSKLDHV